VSCTTWQEAISALADGEDPGVDPALLAAHQARCAGCRAFERAAHELRRRYAVGEAGRMPDLARRVSRLDRIADRMSRWGAGRVLLAVVAAQIIVLSVPDLVLGAGSDTTHDGRHLGAFTLAYGAGLLLVVWRPARARSLLPVAATLAAALVITATVDIAQGRVPLAGELMHLPELASVVLVWSLTVPRRTRSAVSHRDPAAAIRAVDPARAAPRASDTA
jgi:predicted anti-sigma-YlaC factor YlaD